MRNLMIYLPVFLFFIAGFQLKAEENTGAKIENPLMIENELVVQDPALSSGLVWDKINPKQKRNKKHRILINNCGKIFISDGTSTNRKITGGETLLSEPDTPETLNLHPEPTGTLEAI